MRVEHFLTGAVLELPDFGNFCFDLPMPHRKAPCDTIHDFQVMIAAVVYMVGNHHTYTDIIPQRRHSITNRIRITPLRIPRPPKTLLDGTWGLLKGPGGFSGSGGFTWKAR